VPKEGPESNPTLREAPRTPPIEQRLDGWGEIATYLKIEQRTAQRWEESRGLPVRRIGTRVYAHKSELDAWIRRQEPRWIKKLLDAVRLRARRPATIVAASVVLLAAAYTVWRIWPWLGGGPRKAMLVVLPFDNLSGDPEQKYYSDEFTEELTTELGRLHPESLGVIAPGSARLVKGKSISQIGHDLAVQYVLEGTVTQHNNEVHITAHLTQVSDQTQLWADSYSRSEGDVLALQSDVAGAIARQIQLKLTPQEQARLGTARPVNPKAHDAYLRGRAEWNKRTPQAIQAAISDFQQAVAEDPLYAPAYAGLADAFALLGSVPNDALPPREAMPKAEQAAEKAIECDNSLANAHVSLAYIRMVYDWKLPEAQQQFQEALELNPGYATGHEWYALYLAATGQEEAAIAEIEKAQELDPLSTIMDLTAAQIFLYAGQNEGALEQCRRALERDPDFYLVYYFRGRALEQKHLLPEAIADFQKGSTLSGGSPLIAMALGHAYAISGRTQEANNLLAGLISLSKQRYVPAVYMVGVAAGLGDRSEAFRWLNQAIRDRCDYVVFLGHEPGLENLRSDERFRQAMNGAGLIQ